MKTINLLPCPFCPEHEANEAGVRIANHKKKHFDKIHFTVECTNCGCEPDFCCETEKEAIFKWNERRNLSFKEKDIAYVNSIKERLIAVLIKSQLE